ncbi:MAG TPA: hypothetical protein VMD59_13375 [Acidimicrobiales bacterium]|nr:hypothetical protein [Acidimicrobiales bacterium]
MGSRQRLVAASGAVLGGVALVAAVAAQGALAAGAAPVRAGGRPSAAPETRAIGGRRTVPGASGATLALLTAKLSSYSASATDVTYTVSFVTPTELSPAASSTITLTGPAGTAFDGTAGPWFVRDDSTGGNCGPLGTAKLGSGSASITLTCGGAGAAPIPAGDLVTVSVSSVTNAPSAGSHSLAVSTSGDPAGATVTYDLTAASSVGSAMVQQSTTAAGATGTWAIGFVATNGWEYETQVHVDAPAGTSFPTSTGDYCLSDDGTDQARCWSGATSVTGAPGNDVVVTIAVGFGNGEYITAPVAAGDHVTLTIKDVKNPASGDAVSVATGADPLAAHLALGAPAAAGVALSSTQAGAKEVAYEIGFTAAVTQKVSTVRLAFPKGTKFQAGHKPYDVVRDDAATGSENTLPVLTEAQSGSTLVLTTSSTYGRFTIDAGDYVTVLVYGVTNPSGLGAHQVVVSTNLGHKSFDLPAFDLTAAAKVGALGIVASSTSAGATKVHETISFQVSGGLTFGGAYSLAPSTVTVSLPGASFATSGYCDEILNDTTGNATGCPQVKLSGGKGTLTLEDDGYAQTRVTPGDEVTVSLSGVTNPPASGDALSVSTSSDAVPASTSYSDGG